MNEGKMADATPVAPKAKKSVALSGVTAGNTALCTVGRSGNDNTNAGSALSLANSATSPATRPWVAK